MKNWYENIPPQGVLCKNKVDGEVIKVLSYNAENDYVLSNKIDFEGDKEIFYPSDLTPLTAEEIWQFIPWNYPVNTPENMPFLGQFSYEIGSSFIIQSVRVGNHYYNTEADAMEDCKLIKWIPLP
jgi:hypothetical protein